MNDRILSVFIDESGDFGGFEPTCPYYIVTMVLHDQHISVVENVKKFDEHLSHATCHNHAIHAGPLIRREKICSELTRQERRYLFNALFYFAHKLDFHYIAVHLKKNSDMDRIQLTSKLSKEIANQIKNDIDFWSTYNKIIVYYDNGQIELTKILTSVFTVLFDNIEFRKVKPVDYKLFQIADMVCTLELLDIKTSHGTISKSEHDFFGNIRKLKKDYLKIIQKKRLR